MAQMVEKGNEHIFVVKNHKRKRVLGILRGRRENNIKICLKEIRCEDTSGLC